MENRIATPNHLVIYAKVGLLHISMVAFTLMLPFFSAPIVLYVIFIFLIMCLFAVGTLIQVKADRNPAIAALASLLRIIFPIRRKGSEAATRHHIICVL